MHASAIVNQYRIRWRRLPGPSENGAGYHPIEMADAATLGRWRRAAASAGLMPHAQRWHLNAHLAPDCIRRVPARAISLLVIVAIRVRRSGHWRDRGRRTIREILVKPAC